MRTAWEKRKWEPKVGMKIQKRQDIRLRSDKARHNPDAIAEIKSIDAETKSLKIRYDNGRDASLKVTTWQSEWKPVPEPKPRDTKNEERKIAASVPNTKKKIFVTVEQESSHDEGGQESLRSGDELIDLHVDGSRHVLAESLRNLVLLVSSIAGNPIVRARVMILLDHPHKTN